MRSELRRHNRLYYEQAEPEISDAEYDALFLELENWKSPSRTVGSGLPTRRVGGASPGLQPDQTCGAHVVY
ncbi:MAG: DNA ligase LigA-related protein [Akkermansia sp.]